MFNAFDAIEDHFTEPSAKPSRTLPVLLMLVVAAAGFSYLGAYAVPDALAAAGVLGDATDAANRPRLLALLFASLMGLFLIGAVIARFFSARHLRRIDAMTDE